MNSPEYIKARKEMKFDSMQKARVKIQEEILGLKNNSQNNIEQIQNVEALERLQAMKRIENIERLERLQSLKSESVDNILFYNDDYRNVPIPDNSIIYCDIPYNVIRGKYNKSKVFDYDAFYNWCVDMKNKGYEVFISEYNISDDRFEEVWRKEKSCSISQTQNNKTIEKIYKVK